ncbi:PREDICTED: WD repeat-containing protein 63-like [Polistes canadensis]|uniref:WD repeat-containing protein 63-like n=1 Tax=Polistes canadensis TaxID=91411 RepID=UPI000718EE55|nr:PREDICTED: WD repeat-containing protein 63-like [Polistes canadensis]
MLRKRVKYPKGWTLLLDENIKNVERVIFDPETQKKLGCTVGEYVFLEYPWVYVPRDDVLRLSNKIGSCLEPYRDQISVYNGTCFLIGYNSTELYSDQFVICLTEETRDAIYQRNKNISKAILNGVYEQIEKIPKIWKSLDSENDLESSAKNTRELLEIEINLPTTLLGLNRQISDRNSDESRDSYIDLVPPANETFDNISKFLISRSTQTHLPSREAYVQTYPGNPKNAWTQYVYEDTLNGKLFDLNHSENIDKSLDETVRSNEDKEELEDKIQEDNKIELVREKEPIEIFLEKYSEQMIDEIKYNAVVNLYVDDIKNLKKDKQETMKSMEIPISKEYQFFINLNIIQSNIISDISWHPKITELAVVSYIRSANVIPNSDYDSGALLWSLSDTLRPLSYLRSNVDVHCITFCPLKENIVIGGCENGQLIIWHISNDIINFVNTTNNNCQSKIFELPDQKNVPVVNVTTTSEKDSSHRSLIRQIKWIPMKFRAKSNGKFVESSNEFNNCQFMTISLDGIIIIWSLDLSSNLLNDCLQIIYKLSVPIPNYTRNFTLICLSISLECLEEEEEEEKCNNVHRKVKDFDKKEEEEEYNTRRLWLGTGEGELVRCTWEGQVFDVGTSDSEKCNFLDRSFAHDGPVIEIVRCHRMLEVILTIGGHIFSIWHENYSESPIFWRKSKSIYTACCWSCKPGCFLMGRIDGELEIWDIKRNDCEPIFVRTISNGSLTVLSFWKETKVSSGFIGIGDDKGVFRVFKEPSTYSNDAECMNWFENYILREVQRKKIFTEWQREFLETNPIAIAKKLKKIDEERKRRLEETKDNLQKEYEQRLRLEAEKRALNVPKSKETIWKLKEQKRMRNVILEKKGFVPDELEKRKMPLVRLQEEKCLRLQKIKKEVNIRDQFYEDIVTLRIPELSNSFQRTNTIIDDEDLDDDKKVETNMEEYYMQQYCNVRDDVRKILAEKLDRTII